MSFDIVHNLINPETGNTYKEDNLRTMHKIPLLTLVEVKFDQWYGDGACLKAHARLWVVKHTRDCDGTPLYTLSQYRDPGWALSRSAFHNFSEDDLTPIKITQELKDGYGALDWEEPSEVQCVCNDEFGNPM